MYMSSGLQETDFDTNFIFAVNVTRYQAAVVKEDEPCLVV